MANIPVREVPEETPGADVAAPDQAVGGREIWRAPYDVGENPVKIHGRALIGDRFVAEGPVPVSIYVARGASPEIGDHLYMIAGTHIEA